MRVDVLAGRHDDMTPIQQDGEGELPYQCGVWVRPCLRCTICDLAIVVTSIISYKVARPLATHLHCSLWTSYALRTHLHCSNILRTRLGPILPRIVYRALQGRDTRAISCSCATCTRTNAGLDNKHVFVAIHDHSCVLPLTYALRPRCIIILQ